MSRRSGLQGVRVGRFVAQYTTDEAPGAIANGTRIAKQKSTSGDAHQDGALAIVLGSKAGPNGTYLYFVEWDDSPGLPVAIRGDRITPAKEALC